VRGTYAMDTGFFSPLGSYPLRHRCEMTAELGFTATYLTLWNERAWRELEELTSVAREHDLDVAAVHVALDLDDRAPLERLLSTLELVPRTTVIEVAIRSTAGTYPPSRTDGDEAAREQLEEVVAARAASAAPVSLYPHVDHWLETHEDAQRLLSRLPTMGLRTNVNGYHWYATGRRDPSTLLPKLASDVALTNLCGSRYLRREDRYTLEPLDAGELDNFALLGVLRRHGFDGPVGIQGFAVAGDAYAHLRRSLHALEDLERRIREHPAWAELVWDRPL
jgi:sugar phosphate isomerase/epimerase